MLGCVDEYDDTYFSQMRLLIPEREELGRSSSPVEAAMAAQLLNRAKTFSMHDQMIFVGD